MDHIPPPTAVICAQMWETVRYAGLQQASIEKTSIMLVGKLTPSVLESRAAHQSAVARVAANCPAQRKAR